jgi:SpoVK/Ycf46/Vps4 family AAA+-type ATPase
LSVDFLDLFDIYIPSEEESSEVFAYADNADYLWEIIRYVKLELFSHFLSNCTEAGDELFFKSKAFKTQLLADIAEGLEGYWLENEGFDLYAFSLFIQENASKLWEQVKLRESESYGQKIYLAVPYLFKGFRLNALEKRVFLLSLANETDPRVHRIVDNLSGCSLELGFALEVFLPEVSDFFSNIGQFTDGSKLFMYFYALSGDEKPFLTRPLKIDKRIIDFVLQPDSFSAEMQSYSYFTQDQAVPELICGEDVSANIASYMEIAKKTSGGKKPLIFIYGPTGSGKKLQVRHYAKARNFPVIFVDMGELSQNFSNQRLIDRYALVIKRETLLKKSLLCFTNFDKALENRTPSQVFQFVSVASGFVSAVFILSVSELRPDTDFYFMPVGIRALNNLERANIWQKLSPGYNIGENVVLTEVANKFEFSVGQIEKALEFAKKIATLEKREIITEDDLIKGCYNQVTHNLEDKAARIKSFYTMDDLILDKAEKEIIRTACDQMFHRHTVYNRWGFDKKATYGIGLSILFTGPPGTGKTMAAEIISNELKLELYKIDLSAVVSKYIGETEKNISSLFNEAKKSSAILFFDEADALFAKRTEVKDSHDKSSNMEAAFLLQKIEEYTGLVILATNFYQNFDDAFKRRIKLVVNFTLPNKEYRKTMWQTIFPDDAPRDNLDYDFLARFELSGSNIKNIAINAAFISAANHRSIDMESVVKSLYYEIRKSGKILLKEELEEYRGYIFS